MGRHSYLRRSYTPHENRIIAEMYRAGRTAREIAEHVGRSSGAIQAHLALLQQQGKLERKYRKQATPKQQDTVSRITEAMDAIDRMDKYLDELWVELRNIKQQLEGNR